MKPDLRAVKQLHDALQQAGLSHLTDASQVSSLPFPSLKRAPERFCWKDGVFQFVGRSAMRDIEIAVVGFLNPPPPRLFAYKSGLHKMLVYGTFGAGKSHMLMALSLKLRQQYMGLQPVTRRIVVVFNATELIGNQGFSNMLQAMLIAHADDALSLDSLAMIQDWGELMDFCTCASGNLVFMVDQAEEIDISVTSLNTPAAHARAMLLSLVGEKHYAIFGASATAEMAKFRNKSKQSGFDFYDVFGGITEKEMVAWLAHTSITLSTDQITALYDYSGGVPMFLSWFIAIVNKHNLFGKCFHSFSIFQHVILGTPNFFTAAFEEYKQSGYIIKICNDVDELVSTGKLSVSFLTNSATSTIDFDSQYQNK